MWRMTPRIALATLAATLALAVEAPAASVQSSMYYTGGSVSTPSGSAPITFEGIAGTFTDPGTFSLGHFATAPSASTQAYDNTPFRVDLYVANGTTYGGYPLFHDYVISGVLKGSTGGPGASNLMATVTSIANGEPLPVPASIVAAGPPFQAAAFSVLPQGIIVSDGTNGVTPLYAQVNSPALATPAPEPSTIAILGLALAGWAGHRRARAKA